MLPEPVSVGRRASATARGLLLWIVTRLPVDPGVKVTVRGIWRPCPTVPPVICTKFGLPGRIVIEIGAEVDSWGLLESFTVTVPEYVAADPIDGIPLIAPVLGLIDSPGGNPVADHV
jgi:hypothetical protein